MALVWIMKQMIDRAGSIEAFFLEGYDPAAEDVEGALDSFSTRALALDLRAAYGKVPKRPGVCYFFPRPSAGSGCKRLNLFLRWMVRRDALDLGVWTRVSPAKLVVPLDTHVIRVGRCLRLTRYASPGWPMARDITASLRRLDSGRSGEVRLRAVPPRHDERVRVQSRRCCRGDFRSRSAVAAGCSMPASWPLPATRA